MSHDYFEFNNDFYQQQEGLAMVAPSSAILQFMERSNIYDILLKQKIVCHFRYVDDILVYNEDYIDINLTLQEFDNNTIQKLKKKLNKFS